LQLADLNREIIIENEAAMAEFAAQLASEIKAPCIIYLKGELGAGKTTLTRGFLRALGYEGPVRSPTFTLIESYEIQDQKVFHVDLYRLHSPEEIEFIGLREYFTEDVIGLIEWPERALELLPPPDIICEIKIQGSSRSILIKHLSSSTK
jgi:tRNA threonylcarbamoyladenosine biosynthesis protein TsaE